MLLDELLPEVFVVGNQFERRGQTEIMPVVRQQLHAKGVDRAEEGAVERAHDFRVEVLRQNLLAAPLLHFVRRAIRERHHHQTWEDFPGLTRTRDFKDPVRDCAGFSRTGGRNDGKIAIEFFREPIPIRLIARRAHQ